MSDRRLMRVFLRELVEGGDAYAEEFARHVRSVCTQAVQRYIATSLRKVADLVSPP